METFTAGGTPQHRAEPQPLPAAPPEIPGYRIGAEIGRGGFGIVYRAEQLQPVQRPVAIKLLRTEFATSETAARFRIESAVLARMNHEGIARVLDAGLDTTGRPFVVMELIDGLPLIEYCEQRRLSVRDRVRLMIRVCDVVHHAHQRAVIHRDLKPANILVEEIDGQARPRVIDFGIAKLLEDRANDTVTRDGRRIGTPRYMSPEQRRGTDTADTRIDVYALGVLLCEALTGEVPYANTESDDGSGRRTTTRGTKPSTLAAGAGGPVATRARELKGDLDRIVLKAVASEPALRYTSAAALAEDLRRFLAGKPVEATTPGWFYLSRKFIARRKGISAAVLLAGLSLAVGGATLIIGLEKARENTEAIEDLLHESEKEREHADAVARFLLGDVLESLSPSVTGHGEPRVRDVLRRASLVSRQTLTEQPELQVDLLRRVGVAQRALSDFQGAAESFLAAAEIGRDRSVLPLASTLDLRIDAILARMSAKQLDDIGIAIEAIRITAESELGDDHLTTLRAKLHAAHIAHGEQAAGELRGIAATLEQRGLSNEPVYFEALRFLGAVLAANGEDEAIDVFRRAVDLAVGRLGPLHAETIELKLRLGAALHDAGRAGEADPVLLEVADEAMRGFGPGSIFLSSALLHLTRLALAEERFDDAYDRGRRLLETVRERDLDESLLQATGLQLFGEAQVGVGDLAEAARTFQRALEILDIRGETTSPAAMNARVWRGETMLALDHPADLVDVVLPIFDHAPPGDEVRVRAALTLAEAYLRLYRSDEAHDLIQRELDALPIGSPFETRLADWLNQHAGD